MKKFLFFSLLLVLGIIILWGGLNYYILPKAINKLQNSISGNTPYRVHIKKLRYRLTGIEIPTIEISTPQGEFQLQSVVLKLIPQSLLNLNPALKGEATLIMEGQKTEIEITNINYSLTTRSGQTQFRIPEISWENIFWLANNSNYQLPPGLRIEGKSLWTINLTWGRSKPLTLQITVKTSRPEIKYAAITFNPRNLNLKIQVRNGNYSWEGKGSDISVFTRDKKLSFMKEIKITGQRGNIDFNISEGILTARPFSGKLQLIVNKESPALKYDFQIAGLRIQGKGYMEKNEIKTKGKFNQISFSAGYGIKDKKIVVNASGNAKIEELYSVLFPQKEHLLKSISGTINLKKISLVMDIPDKNMQGELVSTISNLKYKNVMIAEDGNLTAEIKNHTLNFKNLELYPQNGKISTTGEIDLQKPFNFSGQITLASVSLRRFLLLFTPRNLGDAHLWGWGVFQGNGDNIPETRAQFTWRFENGDLGKIKFLTQLGELLGRPDIAKIGFQEGEGKFVLQREKLFIPQAVFISPLVNIYLQGEIALSGELDLTAITKFAQPQKREEVSPLDALQKLLLQGLGEIAYKIKITGTLNQPKYTLIPAAVDDLFKNLLP